MRDDIHRRLALPRVWKHLVRACERDAEESVRPNFADSAVRAELRQVRRGWFATMMEDLALASMNLFPSDSFRPTSSAVGPIEHSFESECRARIGMRINAAEVGERALQQALQDRVEAITRETRAQAILDAGPKNAGRLVSRFTQALSTVDYQAIAASFIAGKAPEKAFRLTLDLDLDLRGKR